MDTKAAPFCKPNPKTGSWDYKYSAA